MSAPDGLRPARILLTLSALEFFGPAVRDLGDSHALNVAWVPHARLHMVWFIGFLVLSGLVNLHLIWGRRSGVAGLRISAAWQACALGGFWIALATQGLYGGSLIEPGHHVEILGVEENLLGFCILSALWLAGVVMLRRRAPAAAA